MIEDKLVDHLFRHQYGKMVAILTRIFGLSNLETIEDAVQDTFIVAMHKWRNILPENPEAWLTLAAKNRAIDLLRKIKAEQTRIGKIESGTFSISFNELFLDHEIEDSQLRMIFTACHPSLHPKEQIAFALKTISGFNTKEIASALLLKEETIKKRLTRARKLVSQKNISFEIPKHGDLLRRLDRVLEVIYLTFNEGFHSNGKQLLIRKDLCGEAIRLIKIVLSKKDLRIGKVYALFALMCFHASRLDSRIGSAGEILDLKNQDRSKWYFPLIRIGNDAMIKAVEDGSFTSYHYEAAIAGEHIKAKTFDDTDWEKMLLWYENLDTLQPSPLGLLNKSIVLIQLNRLDAAKDILNTIESKDLEQRAYLYYATLSEYCKENKNIKDAIENLDIAISMVANKTEKAYLEQKKKNL